jgi:hypothetical protein
MSAMVEAVISGIESLATSKGFSYFRAGLKVNAKGDLVVALILAPRRPGEWEEWIAARERDTSKQRR